MTFSVTANVKCTIEQWRQTFYETRNAYRLALIPSTAVVLIPTVLAHSSFAHFGTFHFSPVRVRWQVFTTIGTMVFIDNNNFKRYLEVGQKLFVVK